jgi:hypothetical protein
MFELIVLALVVAGLAALARAPMPKKHHTETPTCVFRMKLDIDST